MKTNTLVISLVGALILNGCALYKEPEDRVGYDPAFQYWAWGAEARRDSRRYRNRGRR